MPSSSSHGARDGGGGSRRRQDEAVEAEAEEEEAIMEAIARSLREEEDRAQRRGGQRRGGARCADDGEREGEEGERNLGEVAAMVESRGWVQRFGSTVSLASLASPRSQLPCPAHLLPHLSRLYSARTCGVLYVCARQHLCEGAVCKSRRMCVLARIHACVHELDDEISRDLISS